MDTDPIEWILFGLFLLIGGTITVFMVMDQKRQIRESLEKKGFRNIVVSWMPFDFDKSNHSYDVSYQDASGKMHQTSCKMHVLGATIYWQDED
jgi:hypothetical protein